MSKTTIRRKSGDGLPCDITGQMLYVGSIVTVPHQFFDGTISVKFAVVDKLFKNGKADITIFIGLAGRQKLRVEKASEILTLIDPDKMNPKIELFEALKMQAKEVEYASLND